MLTHGKKEIMLYQHIHSLMPTLFTELCEPSSKFNLHMKMGPNGFMGNMINPALTSYDAAGALDAMFHQGAARPMGSACC